jgi:hypothetical protein
VSAKQSAPSLFSTRWAMSYLRGPLTKDQVAELMKGVARPPAAEPVAAQAAAAAAPAAPALRQDETTVAPAAAAGAVVRYLDPGAPWAARVGAAVGGSRLRAFLAARVSLRYDDSAAAIDETEEFEAVYGPLDGGLDLENEAVVDFDDRDLRPDPPAGVAYVLPTAPIGRASFFKDAERDIRGRLVDRRTLEIFRNRPLKLTSRPGESRDEFLTRCDAAAQAAADKEAARITDRLEAKRDRLESALELAQRRVEELDVDMQSRATNELVAGAGAVLGALLGGRRSARSITTAISGASSRRGMTQRTSERRRTAEAKVLRTTEDLQELEQEILDEVAEIDADWKAKAGEVESVPIRLEASDLRVTQLALVWVPTA